MCILQSKKHNKTSHDKLSLQSQKEKAKYIQKLYKVPITQHISRLFLISIFRDTEVKNAGGEGLIEKQ